MRLVTYFAAGTLLFCCTQAFTEELEDLPDFPSSALTLEEEMENLFEIVDLQEPSILPEVSEMHQAPIAHQEESSLLVLSSTEEDEAPSAATFILDEPKALSTQVESPITPSKTPFTLKIDFRQVFAGSPIIYTVLALMSVLTLFIWLYSQIHLRMLGSAPDSVMRHLRDKLNSNQYDEALEFCKQHENLLCKMLSSGIHARKYGPQVMLESMKAEGKRSSVKFWQRISLLNDIAVIAPMLGLLGTVLGMFYAFYDMNRSVESVSALFDGLGISVGTTVAGLAVAIISMMLYSISRYRLVRRLAFIESEAHAFASIIDNHH